jgi:predicted N-formylglutamate amidohydrolase
MMKDNIEEIFTIENMNGKSDFVILADHASNHIPLKYANLGLSEIEKQMHIAWDPGTLPVAKILAKKFDAPLVHSKISRLVIDCNRALFRDDLITSLSEDTKILGNIDLSQKERQHRIDSYHQPYHNAITNLLDKREAQGLNSIIVSIHSFTPSYNGISRPWEIGFLPDQKEQFTKELYESIKAKYPNMNVGWNEPYAALQGVHYTMDLHCDKRGLHGSMIEIRNNEIADKNGVNKWAEILTHSMQSSLAKI